MVKKPMVANIQPMNISSKPTTITVNIAPHQRRRAAVVKDASPDFCARLLKVFRRCVVAKM